MQALRKQPPSYAHRVSESVPSSHTMQTVRVEALASLPIAEEESTGRMTAASIPTGPFLAKLIDVVPPSPRVPTLERPRSTRRGRWRADILAEWVKYQSERAKT